MSFSSIWSKRHWPWQRIIVNVSIILEVILTRLTWFVIRMTCSTIGWDWSRDLHTINWTRFSVTRARGKLCRPNAKGNLLERYDRDETWLNRVECLNSFIGLISTTKERIQCMFDIGRQTQFCEVLLEVLDDFRRRLLQISKHYNGNSQRWYDIMNVVYSVKVLLRNWRLDQACSLVALRHRVWNDRCSSDVHRHPRA